MADATRDELVSTFGVAKGLACSDLISGKLDPVTFEPVENWVRACYHEPSENELILAALNCVLEGYGVEAIRVEDAWVDSFHGDIVGTYVNMGDSYAATVVLDSETHDFIISTWADFFTAVEEELAKGES